MGLSQGLRLLGRRARAKRVTRGASSVMTYRFTGNKAAETTPAAAQVEAFEAVAAVAGKEKKATKQGSKSE